MAERNVVKPRECRTCGQKIEATAQGIKDHAKKCGVTRG